MLVSPSFYQTCGWKLTDSACSAAQDSDPPSVKAMSDFLVESGSRAFRPTLVTNVMGYNSKYEQDIHTMADLANRSTCGLSEFCYAPTYLRRSVADDVLIAQ